MYNWRPQVDGITSWSYYRDSAWQALSCSRWGFSLKLFAILLSHPCALLELCVSGVTSARFPFMWYPCSVYPPLYGWYCVYRVCGWTVFWWAQLQCAHRLSRKLHTHYSSAVISSMHVHVCEQCICPCMLDVHIVHWFEFQLAVLMLLCFGKFVHVHLYESFTWVCKHHLFACLYVMSACYNVM